MIKHNKLKGIKLKKSMLIERERKKERERERERDRERAYRRVKF